MQEEGLKEKYGLDKLVFFNVGNPQSVGQNPVTFHRQVLSLLTNPKLLDQIDNGEVKGTDVVYPADVLARGREYLKSVPKFGAYSDSKGHLLFRKKICEYIDKRDGLINRYYGQSAMCDPASIFITDGAGPAVVTAIELLLRDEKDVVLIPIPQYPLYSATITRLGGTAVGYEMVECYDSNDKGWKLDVAHIEELIEACYAKGQRVRALAVINPGNPTGSVLDERDINALIALAAKHSLCLL